MTSSSPSGSVRDLFLGALAGGDFPTPLQLCCACLDDLPVDRAAIVVSTGTGPMLAAASDADAARVEQEQITLGAGPAVDAVDRAGPVLVPDLARETAARWPALASAAALGGALVVLPLQLGAIRLGVLDLYRARTGSLEPAELGLALGVAELVTTTLLLSSAGYLATSAGAVDGAAWPGADDGPDDREVHQATGMVSVQLACSAAEAYVRLRARAFAEGRPVAELAEDVVSRRVRFGTDRSEGINDVDAS
ncbi:GAF and ANTAR domain-containing protein [Rhodococcus aerolatus]